MSTSGQLGSARQIHLRTPVTAPPPLPNEISPGKQAATALRMLLTALMRLAMMAIAGIAARINDGRISQKQLLTAGVAAGSVVTIALLAILFSGPKHQSQAMPANGYFNQGQEVPLTGFSAQRQQYQIKARIAENFFGGNSIVAEIMGEPMPLNAILITPDGMEHNRIVHDIDLRDRKAVESWDFSLLKKGTYKIRITDQSMQQNLVGETTLAINDDIKARPIP